MYDDDREKIQDEMDALEEADEDEADDEEPEE
jgi:hypothetical protein